MSKAAELTREELVERLCGVLKSAQIEDALDRRETIDSLLAELKALGLAIVPVEPTEEMEEAADVLVGYTPYDGGPSPSDLRRGWELMLSASPFAGN